MKTLELGKTYIIETLPSGCKTIATIIKKKGVFRKRYKAMVRGIYTNGRHDWPNGEIFYYENWLTKEHIENAVEHDNNIS